MRRAMASSSSTIFGARPSEGSSSISRRGALIIARATATICCSPPLMVPASCCARSRSLGKSLEGLLAGAARARPWAPASRRAPGSRPPSSAGTAAGPRAPAPCRRARSRAVFAGRSLAVEQHHAAARDQAGERLQQRGLAGAVGAEDHGQPGPALQRQVAQHQEGPVAGAQALRPSGARGRCRPARRLSLSPHHGVASSTISSPR